MFRFFRKSTAKQDGRELKHSAFRYMEKGRWEQALASWEELVVREPHDLQHRIRLGECLRHLGRGQEAARQWLRAATGWAAEQRWDKAMAAGRLALAEDPFDLNVIHLLDRLDARRRGLTSLAGSQAPAARSASSGEGLEIDGWVDADRRVERTRAVAATTSSTRVPKVLTPPPPPVMEHRPPPPASEVDAMPESVFENLHAGFNSAASSPERPCRCGRCARCVPPRRSARVVPMLDDERVR